MKPSPVQARGLRALSAPYERFRPQIRMNAKRSTGKFYAISNKNLNGHKIRISTANALIKNQWVESIDPSKEYLENDFVISQLGKDILEMLSERDFVSRPTKKPMWSTADILDALNEKYKTLSEAGFDDAPMWIYFDELRSSGGRGSRVDFWAMACWRSLKYKRISYEIKISRGDFLHELKDPSKKEFAMEISNEFYFVTPPGLIKEDELPEDCGLVELSADGELQITVKSPIRNPDFIFTWDFASCLGRKIFKASEKTKSE